MFEKVKQKAILENVPIIKSEAEQFIISELNNTKPQNVVEIGTAIGYSSMVISQHISEWNGNLTTFEVSYLSYNQALKNFIKYNQMNITSYNIDPLLIDIKKIFKSRKIDFLFIDAVMKLYLDFFLKFEDLLENNCTILLDNVVKFKSKTEGLYKFLNENQIEYKIQDIKPNDGIMKIVYKK